MTAQNTKIKVPKDTGTKNGEIVIRFAGDDPETFKIHDDHTVTVPNHRVEKFLRYVPGSSVEQHASTTKKES